MPIFTPFTPTSVVPGPGQGYEKATFDLKATYRVRGGGPDEFEDFHVAKDVASFANAIGGTILVGVQEDKSTGTVAKYEPLSEPDARRHTKAIDDAIEKRCRPRPLHMIERIPVTGGSVLAVNVWPFPPGAVAVLADADPKADYRGYSWVVPLRIGERSTYLEPEQIPMLMIPQLRRTVTLLEQIGRGNAVEVHWGNMAKGHAHRLEDFDAMTNFVRLRELPEPPRTTTPICCPLEAIDRVWKDGTTWRLQMA